MWRPADEEVAGRNYHEKAGALTKESSQTRFVAPSLVVRLHWDGRNPDAEGPANACGKEPTTKGVSP